MTILSTSNPESSVLLAALSLSFYARDLALLASSVSLIAEFLFFSNNFLLYPFPPQGILPPIYFQPPSFSAALMMLYLFSMHHQIGICSQ